MPSPNAVLLISFLLFSTGVAGILIRRNALVILMCAELMLNAANLNFIAFARQSGTVGGPEHEEFSYEEFPFYWLARVHAIYSLEMEKVLKKLGTDIPTRRVLLMLRLHGTVSVSELANHAIIKLSTLTRIVQRMREEGLVETRRC